MPVPPPRHEHDEYDAYAGLVEAGEETRWAFGTGFDDPLAGVDLSLPPGADGPALAAYCLMLGDDALVLAQRLAQWCTRAPELEEEVALANIGLDLVGQTRLLYARAAAADPTVVPRLPEGSPAPPEDRLAFFRGPDDYRCVWLVEQPNGDFAATVVRLTVFAAWRLALLDRLCSSRDPVLAAVSAKGVKEVRYHRDYAARWLLTLAGGTEESRRRTEAALESTWPYVDELGGADDVAERLAADGVAAEPAAAFEDTLAFLRRLLEEGGLPVPTRPADPAENPGGRLGVHSTWLPPLLEEMQGIARAHPAGRW